MKFSSRQELLRQAEVELDNIRESIMKENSNLDDRKNKSAEKGFDYERWGKYIYDPDISQIDYDELRKKDRTLPKKDPRMIDQFKYDYFDMEPAKKWLYFSDELGSFAKRRDLLSAKDYSKKRENILKKLKPDLLTTSQLYDTDHFYNLHRLKEQLPTSFYDLISDKKKWAIPLRFVIGSILHFLAKMDRGDI